MKRKVKAKVKQVKKYKIIYADPPWSYDDKSLNRGGAERHYKTMDIQDAYSQYLIL